MTKAEYQKKREEIRARYGDSASERTGLFEQELARLFSCSGWTIEELAAVENKGKSWVDRCLRFGRFLNFSPAGEFPKNLTEWRFRGYWERTDKDETNERIRFAAIERMMRADLTLQKDRSPFLRAPIAEAILTTFADGKWHWLTAIVEGVKASESDVLAVLENMRKQKTYKVLCERRKGGTSYQYRIVRGRGRKVDVDVLLKEVSPIVQALKAESRKTVVRWSPSTVGRLVAQLEGILTRLTHATALPVTRARKESDDEYGNVSSPEVGSPTTHA